MKLLVVNPFAVTPVRQDFYARVQAASGWEVTIVTPRQWKDDFGRRVRADRWPAYEGGLVTLPVLLQGNIPLHTYLRSLSAVFRRERPDVIYVYHEPYGAATFQSFFANRRVNAPIGFYSSQNILKSYPWPFSAAEQFVYKRAAFAITVSDEVARVLRRKGYAGAAEVIPFSVDGERYRPTRPLDQEGLREDDTLTVGYIGRLVPEKGVDTLLDALARLPQDDFKAIIVGDGPSRETLHRHAEDLGLGDRVRWTGAVTTQDTSDLYHQMDVLVVPSKTVSGWKEQFGRVVIEALASGVCVVTSDSGELPRLVSITGGGLTFKEGDAKALADRLSALRARPSTLIDLRVQGHRSVLNLFSVDGNVRRLIGVLEDAVRQKKLRETGDGHANRVHNLG
jgi:glycosyltransferase involved in cell wall biosynthesis